MSVSPCFDAGSRFCPCELAELGECVACSLLRGESVCTCGWSGLCVYAEFIRDDMRPKHRRSQVAARVKSRLEINDGPENRAFIIDLETPREIAVWCQSPGSFVLVRPKGYPERFNVPLSVMEAGHQAVSLAIEAVGPKTKALEANAREGCEVTLAGPFWSGLQGLNRLQRLAAGRTLIVAKGIAQGCAVQTARYVGGRGGYVKALLGPGPIGKVFAGERVSSAGAEVEVLPKSKDHNLPRVFAELSTGSYGLLVSHGSNIQHRALKDLTESMESPPEFAWSSNLTMTCGEGICGSCLADGFRGCKANVPGDSGFRA